MIDYPPLLLSLALYLQLPVLLPLLQFCQFIFLMFCWFLFRIDFPSSLAMLYLHSGIQGVQIIHRDLAARNVLVCIQYIRNPLFSIHLPSGRLDLCIHPYLLCKHLIFIHPPLVRCIQLHNQRAVVADLGMSRVKESSENASVTLQQVGPLKWMVRRKNRNKNIYPNMKRYNTIVC